MDKCTRVGGEGASSCFPHYLNPSMFKAILPEVRWRKPGKTLGRYH